MEKVTIKQNIVNQYNIVSFEFQENEILLTQLKNQIPNFNWNTELKAWTTPYYPTLKKELFQLLRGRYWLDYSGMKLKTCHTTAKKQPVTPPLAPLNEEHIMHIKKFKNYLLSRRYSPSTIKTYTETVSTFLRFFISKPISEINHNDLIVFNNEYIIQKNLSNSFQNQVVNAVKLFFQIVENKQLIVELLHRPRREKKLPNVLSKEEVKAILEAPKNIKHQAMLSLIYACGLRRGELLNLTLKDIQSDRNLLQIRQAKGKKDRVVPLSLKLIDLLRTYYKLWKPKTWLFEGQIENTKYSEKSLENVLKQSLAKVKITKKVSLHWLRHSYATLPIAIGILESGTDLRYIQELLGHNSSRTTEIYTHVSTRNLQQIRSPFDDL
jgi:integrase/recombinase XerD